MRITTLTALLLLSGIGYGQEKKKIDHTVYDSWNSIGAIKQSTSGTLILYETNPHKGDGKLTLQSADGKIDTSFNRGKNIAIHENDSFIAFLVKPEFDTIRKLKLDKVKEAKFPKDTLVIFHPMTDSLLSIPNVKSFQLAKKGDWLAYLSEDDERSPCKKKKCKLFKRKNKCENPETSGTTLHLINPISNDTHIIHSVVTYKIDREGKQLIYTTSIKGEEDSLSLHYLSFETMDEKLLISNQLKIKSPTFDYTGEQLVFLHSSDTNKLKVYALSYWTPNMTSPELRIDSLTTGMPEDYTISEHYRPYFSRDGKSLFVGVAQIVEQEPEDTLLESEKAKVDVWSGFDLEIQPQQLKNRKRDKNQSDFSRYDIPNKTLIPLGDESIEQVRTMNHGNSNFALGYSSKPYQKATTWDFPWKRDVYLIDMRSGERSMLLEKQAYNTTLSPSGNYVIWYDGPDSNWYCKPVNGTQNPVNLTGTFPSLFASDINGNPHIPYPEGGSGWTLIDDQEYYLVNSRFDVWALCPSDPNNSFCLTNKQGQQNNTRYRLTRFDYDSTYTTIENGLIHGIDQTNKSESYSAIVLKSKASDMNQLIYTPHKFTYISKAENSPQLLFRRMNFLEYGELESSRLDFANPRKLSNTNPQQKEYNWGTVEMLEWTSFEGRALRGLLYKPEDFDSTKSYPMIAYFYEKYTDNIHFHYIPKPTASIIYPTEYVSNGYLVFIPDIEYTPGYPAASAYDCIVSGTDYLTEKFSFIDTARLGLQGQSWGGYQTAQLITMTTKYRAAMAGAPVSNMFSAYGGIRWGSGLSRMFQYERTQSRIGATIWEKPELYIENSPIFGLPNVETPLLIMHNDGDGAVPWYQGIELYMGLRRLDQPVWLLNYNGDQHNLMKNANREDLSIRMRQFFDFYLLDAEMPIWMDEGVPALDKGKNYGLEIKKR